MSTRGNAERTLADKNAEIEELTLGSTRPRPALQRPAMTSIAELESQKTMS